LASPDKSSEDTISSGFNFNISGDSKNILLLHNTIRTFKTKSIPESLEILSKLNDIKLLLKRSYFEELKKEMEAMGYIEIESLGSGSFGVVFKAKNIHRNEYVALKFQLIKNNNTGDLEQDYKKEADVMYYLGKNLNENLIANSITIYQKLIYSHPSRDWKFMIIEMELAKFTLQHIFQEKRSKNEKFTHEERKSLCFNLLEALYMLHMQNISHFDIKPENIFYLDNIEAFAFGDFGVSEHIDKADLIISGNDSLVAITPAQGVV
jgi:serine/threonine protein kinase